MSEGCELATLNVKRNVACSARSKPIKENKRTLHVSERYPFYS